MFWPMEGNILYHNQLIVVLLAVFRPMLIQQYVAENCNCRGRSVAWPPGSPDLTKCEFFMGLSKELC